MHINYSTSSGLKVAPAQISTMPGALCGVDVKCPSSGLNTVTIYDSGNDTLAGKQVLALLEADAGMVSVNHEFFVPVAVNYGVYVDVTGSGTDYRYIVRFTL